MITLQSHTSQVSRRYPHSPESHLSSLKKVSPRVAKCQIFYTDQFFPNEFTPRKSAYIVTNSRPKMHEMGKEGKFQGKTTKDDIIEAVLKTKYQFSCQRVPKKLPVLYSYKLFTPTFQYFYTVISAISVTFCNSGIPTHQSHIS